MPDHYYEKGKSRAGQPVTMDENKYGKYEVEEAASSMDKYAEIMKDKKMQGFIKKYRAHQLKEAQEAASRVGLHERVGKKLKEVFSGS